MTKNKKSKKIFVNLLNELIKHTKYLSEKAATEENNNKNSDPQNFELSDEIKIEMNENFRKLLDSYKRGEINKKQLNEYTNWMKRIFISSLQNLGKLKYFRVNLSKIRPLNVEMLSLEQRIFIFARNIFNPCWNSNISLKSV